MVAYVGSHAPSHTFGLPWGNGVSPLDVVTHCVTPCHPFLPMAGLLRKNSVFPQTPFGVRAHDTIPHGTTFGGATGDGGRMWARTTDLHNVNVAL